MSEPFLGEIKIISWNFPPKGWSFCNGQLLPINQNQALFSILGTTYGGDGRVNFGLPNLQGRMPVHIGGGITPGELGGRSAAPYDKHLGASGSQPRPGEKLAGRERRRPGRQPLGEGGLFELRRRPQ